MLGIDESGKLIMSNPRGEKFYLDAVNGLTRQPSARSGIHAATPYCSDVYSCPMRLA